MWVLYVLWLDSAVRFDSCNWYTQKCVQCAETSKWIPPFYLENRLSILQMLNSNMCELNQAAPLVHFDILFILDSNIFIRLLIIFIYSAALLIFLMCHLVVTTLMRILIFAMVKSFILSWMELPQRWTFIKISNEWNWNVASMCDAPNDVKNLDVQTHKMLYSGRITSVHN